MKTSNIYLVVTFILCLLVSCGSGSKQQQADIDSQNQTNADAPKSEEETSQGPEDFKSFYAKFLKNEDFQLSRIQFPLEGLIAEDGVDIEVIQKKDWVAQKGSVYDVDTKEYQVEIKEQPTEVTHRVYIDGSGIDIESRYKQIDGKWYLVYYKSIFM